MPSLWTGLAALGVVGGIAAGAVVLTTSGPLSGDSDADVAPVATQTVVPPQPKARVELVAGNGDVDGAIAEPGFEDGPALTALFDRPVGLARDSDGNLLIADAGNRRIRLLTPAGDVRTIAGSGAEGVIDGPGLSAEFREPVDLAVAPDGTIYIVDGGSDTIRAIDAGGSVRTVAGIDYMYCTQESKTERPTEPPSPPDGCPGRYEPFYRDGPASQAIFNQPSSIVVSADGEIFVADSGNHAIRKIDRAGIVSTVAGDGTPGYKDGPGPEARFIAPVDLAIDSAGNLYLTEQGHRVRKLSVDGEVTTVAGLRRDYGGGYADGPSAEAEFNGPSGIAVDSAGIIYVSDSQNQRIRRIDGQGNVATLAGKGDGVRLGESLAQFGMPMD
jgi:sugar lactone lactonase YvrE